MSFQAHVRAIHEQRPASIAGKTADDHQNALRDQSPQTSAGTWCNAIWEE
jgi:hypothetical protein